MKTYLVGGAVRDQLLNITPKERDWLVIGATAEQLDTLGFRPVGKDFPVFLHPKTQEEYALARTERKSGKGYKGFTFHTSPDLTIEQDLLRRDLTINAIAQNPDTQELIDPYNGQADIEAKLLRHVSPSFAEDPLRVLRVARFAARLHHLGFSVHPETLQLMAQLANSGELAELAKERIWQEIDKALSTQTPAVFFETLIKCGALEKISPDLHQLFNVLTTPTASDAINQTPYDNTTAKRYAQLWHQAAALGWFDQAHLNKQHAVLTAPKHHRQLANAVALYQSLFHRAHKSDPAAVLALLNNLKAWRSTILFEDFLTVCAIRGTTKNATLLQQCAKNAAVIDVPALQVQGYKGEALGKAIAEQRLLKITQSLKGDTPSN